MKEIWTRRAVQLVQPGTSEGCLAAEQQNRELTQSAWCWSWKVQDRNMDHEKILQELRNELARAQERCDAASREFGEVIHTVGKRVPTPDGADRVRKASRDYSRMQQEAAKAFVRLNEYLIYGDVPPGMPLKAIGTRKTKSDKAKGDSQIRTSGL